MTAPSADVSVVIPAFNAARYLDEAMASVFAQTIRPREVIVVDDGSTDDTMAVAEARGDDGVRTLRQPHRGISAARNAGIRVATGAYLAFLDADDLWTADKLAHQLQQFSATPTLDGAFGSVQQFLSPELDAAQRARFVCPDGPQPGYLAGTLLIRRERFIASGLFDENLTSGEFIAWYLNALEHGIEFELSDKVVLRRRIHTRNTTLSNPEQRNADYLKVVRAHLRAKERALKSG